MHDHGRKVSWGYGMTLHVCDLFPKSRGRVGLSSADPNAPARIEPNYLSHPDDINVLLKAPKIARRVVAAPALAEQINEEVAPGAALQLDVELIADIKARAETIYHPVGTCRMGTDDASVVDPRARARCHGAAGRRCIRYASHHRRQYQCANDDDCRKRC